MVSADQIDLAEADVSRLPWIEPCVTQLDIRATSSMSGTGGDGQFHAPGNPYPDCTRS